MAIRRGRPLKWFAHGLSDCVDSTTVFPGAMSNLSNMIPDPRQADSWVCRPAAIEVLDFSLKGGAFSTAFSDAFDVGVGFTAPGSFISALKIIGTRAYGMIAGTGEFDGFDIPFSYDLSSSTMEVVSGVTIANLPVSTLSSGAWTPPTIDIVGSKVIITHPGFTGIGSNFFGVLDISTHTSPSWTAANTATTALAGVPTAVKQFNNRAWFVVNPASSTPGLYYSDVLDPLTITNASQVLTFGDNTEITALGALPLNNQLGGIIQALIVFKGIANMVQVTGDAALGNLVQNTLNVATGTLAPNTICSTSKGLAFIAPDGLRVIDFNAQVSDPVGISGSGKMAPFLLSVVPSRMAAAYNMGIIRISLQNGSNPGNPQEEYWYDVSRSLWNGPHSFPASLIEPYSNTFIVAPEGVGGKLFQSDVLQTSVSTYVENGTQLSFLYKTPLLPNTGQMADNSIIETAIDMALSAATPAVTVSAIDHDGSVLGSTLFKSPTSPTLWGAFTWGDALWSGAANSLRPRRIDWPNPIVADQFYIQVTGNSSAGVALSKMYFRYEILGYMAA